MIDPEVQDAIDKARSYKPPEPVVPLPDARILRHTEYPPASPVAVPVQQTGIIDAAPQPPDFEYMGKQIGALVAEKNKAYGDSFARCGDILKTLYPSGVKPEQYGDLLAIARVLDKLFRIASDKGAFGESPWRDVAGYGILGWANDERGA